MTEIASERLVAVTDDILRLIEVESPSGDFAALNRSADAVAALVELRLGVTPERVDRDGVPHLRVRFGGGPSTVLLLAHHDTVWPLDTLKRIPGTVENGVLRGPGCFDMLCGLVMAVHALAMLRDGDANGADGATLLVTGDEEVGSASSRALIESEARGCRAALVLEASADEGAVKVGRKGASIYTVIINGLASHAGLDPERGANATVEAAHQVLAIAAMGDAVQGTTVTPTLLQSGTTTNTVPARAEVHVDARAMTQGEQTRVDTAIRGLGAHVPGCTLLIEGGINRPPMDPNLGSSLFDRAQQVAAQLGLPPLTSAVVGGASDGNFTAGVGVPTLDGLGAVGGGAHADSEHVIVGAIPDRLALLVQLTKSLLAATN